MIAEDTTIPTFTRADLRKWDALPKEQQRRYHGNRTPEPRTQVQVRHSMGDTRMTPVVPHEVYRAVHQIADRYNFSVNLMLLKLLLRGIIAVQDGEDL